METQVQRVIATSSTVDMIRELQTRFGELVFHQSGGCCDGSAPMCFQKGELMMDQSDILMGEIEGCEFYMSSDQYEYWKHTQLIIDLVQGRGSSFSLEIPTGFRFVTKSRLFTEEELEAVGHR
jgi:uncharacterized protein (DUF779 family)